MRPDGRTGVDWARTSVRTVRGEVSAAWSAVRAPDGAEFMRVEPGSAVYEVGHGGWEFAGRVAG